MSPFLSVPVPLQSNYYCVCVCVCVCVSNLCWSSSDGSERLVLEYPNIVIHAVSRDTSAFPHHCVYLQYVTQGSEEGEGEEEEEEVKMTEYRLVPSSTDQC